VLLTAGLQRCGDVEQPNREVHVLVPQLVLYHKAQAGVLTAHEVGVCIDQRRANQTLAEGAAHRHRHVRAVLVEQLLRLDPCTHLAQEALAQDSARHRRREQLYVLAVSSVARESRHSTCMCTGPRPFTDPRRYLNTRPHRFATDTDDAGLLNDKRVL